MRIESDLKLDYNDVLFRPKRSTLHSRQDVSLERSFHFKHSVYEWSGVPIVATNMDTIGTFEMAKAFQEFKLLVCLHKHYTVEEIIDFFQKERLYDTASISSGITEQDMEKLDTLLEKDPNIKILCLDVANGYSEKFASTVARVREKHSEKIIIAGNVVTGEMTEELILQGADIVKVGIGSGSVCTTRIQTGVGYPQLSAVIECSDAAHGVGGHVMADGGCVVPGDVAKAFGAGADFAMLGGMLAGHEECTGETEEIDGKKYKIYYGMSSETAMKKYHGKVAEYRSSEGKTVKVPYKGKVEETMKSILGGVRSTCTYIGAKTIKNISKCTTFVRVARQSNEVFGKNS